MNNTILPLGSDFRVEPERPWDRATEGVYGPTRSPSHTFAIPSHTFAIPSHTVAIPSHTVAIREAGGDLHETLPVESDPNGIDQHAPGAKCDAGKQLAGVLLDFSRALEAVADVGTFGANKYTRGGWQSVPNAQERYLDAFMRHLLKMQREDIDPDSGLDHLAHLAWNCLAVLELRLRGAA